MPNFIVTLHLVTGEQLTATLLQEDLTVVRSVIRTGHPGKEGWLAADNGAYINCRHVVYAEIEEPTSTAE